MNKAEWYSQCGQCGKTCTIKIAYHLGQEEARIAFAKKGWHIRPSRCAEHQTEEQKEKVKELVLNS